MQTLSFPLFTPSLSFPINPHSPFASLTHLSSLTEPYATARRSIPLQASASDSAFASSSTIAVDNSDADDSTAFVIRARSRIGLLQVITRVFKVLGLTVDRATVEFEGDFFVKKFFVTDSHGNKIEDSDSLERIKRALAEAIGGDGDGMVSVTRPAVANSGVVVRRSGLVDGVGERRAKAERMFTLQLEFAAKISNVRYQHTPSTMSMAELEKLVASEGTVDLVTIAQSLHWFDLATFYQQVKWVLKKLNGVIAAWCYYLPRVSDEIDTVFDEFYSSEVGPYWDPARKLVDKLYGSIDFPFEAVEGADHTGPFEFVTETLMDLDDFLTYIKSWSAYQTAKEKGVELLPENVVQKFKLAWGEDGKKVARFPIYLRMGKVGDA